VEKLCRWTSIPGEGTRRGVSNSKKLWSV